jgi:hypothetical protein
MCAPGEISAAAACTACLAGTTCEDLTLTQNGVDCGLGFQI